MKSLLLTTLVLLAPVCWGRPAPAVEPIDKTLPVVRATADLGTTYQAKGYGDPKKLDGADIQAAICSPACNERCAIELLPGTYENVEAYFPSHRHIPDSGDVCDLSSHNECTRLGYTGMTGTSQKIELFGHGESKTLLRLADRTADHRNCTHPEKSGPKYHLRAAITIRQLSEAVVLHDFTIDGRLSEQPAPPGGNLNVTAAGYFGIEQSRAPSVVQTPLVEIRRVTVRDVVEAGIAVRNADRTILDSVTVRTAGVHPTEPGHINQKWIDAKVPGVCPTCLDQSAGFGAVLFAPHEVTNSTFDYISKDGIAVHSKTGSKIVGNKFSRTRTGIALGSFNWDLQDALVERNEFSDMGFVTDDWPRAYGHGEAVLFDPRAYKPGVIKNIQIKDNVARNLATHFARLFLEDKVGSGTFIVSGNRIEKPCLAKAMTWCRPIDLWAPEVNTIVWQDNTVDWQPYTIQQARGVP